MVKKEGYRYPTAEAGIKRAILFEWLDENIECDDDMMIGHNVIYPA